MRSRARRAVDEIHGTASPVDFYYSGEVHMNEQRFSRIRRVLWIILFANLAVAFVKLLIGILIRSNSLSADGLHSLTDGTSNIVGLIGIWLAAKPMDEDHPYGHRKFETLAGLFIGAMLLLLSVRIISTAITRFSHPVAPEVSLESLFALAGTLVINIFVSKYELHQGQQLHSDILVSDSYHTRSDIFVSVGVLVTLIAIKLGVPPIIDPIVSLAVAGFIFYAAYEILRPTLAVLSDKAALEETLIKEVAYSFSEVNDVHKVRSRGYADEVFVDLHIMIDPKINVEESHRLIHAIEQRMAERTQKNVSTVVHVEPYYPPEEPVIADPACECDIQSES